MGCTSVITSPDLFQFSKLSDFQSYEDPFESLTGIAELMPDYVVRIPNNAPSELELVTSKLVAGTNGKWYTAVYNHPYFNQPAKLWVVTCQQEYE